CQAIGKKANRQTFSIGVGIQPGINPMTEEKNFELAEDEIEFGLGIHGEPGMEKLKMCDAHTLVNKMAMALLNELDKFEEKQLVVCINGLGSTTHLELYTVNFELNKILQEHQFIVVDTEIGCICTTQEMAGFSLTTQVLTDDLI